MELTLKKLGNSTGVIFPAPFLREHNLFEGCTLVFDEAADGGFTVHLKRARPKYSAAELNALCDPKAPMPDDLVDWDRAPTTGSEVL